MTREVQAFVLVIFLIALRSIVSDEQICKTTFVCCKKIYHSTNDTYECEYCELPNECVEKIVPEGGTGDGTTQMLKPKLCRKGFRHINGVCRRVL